MLGLGHPRQCRVKSACYPFANKLSSTPDPDLPTRLRAAIDLLSRASGTCMCHPRPVGRVTKGATMAAWLGRGGKRSEHGGGVLNGKHIFWQLKPVQEPEPKNL